MLLLQANHACMTFRTHLTGYQAQTSDVQHVVGGRKDIPPKEWRGNFGRPKVGLPLSDSRVLWEVTLASNSAW